MARDKRHCVICDVTMEPKRVDDVTVDVCPDCHGLWLDKDEIRQLSTKDDEALEALRTHLASDMPGFSGELVERPCPACSGKLTVAQLDRLFIRHCSECDGIFLEREEFDRALAAIKERYGEASTIVALAQSVVARGIIDS